MNDLDIIIVNYNTPALTGKCLRSIQKIRWNISYQIFMVDNASTDDSVGMIRKNFPKVSLIKSEKNNGFAGGNNLALKKSSARYALLLNSDTEVLPGSLDMLVEFMEKNDFGICSCKLIDKEGRIQPNAGDLPFGLPLFFWLGGLDDVLLGIRGRLPSFHRRFIDYYENDREVGWVSGSVMVIRQDVLKKIGLLDGKIFMYGEDVEYCIRARKAGFRVGWTKSAQIKHLGGGSSSDPAFRQWVGEYRGLLYIYKKYYGFWGVGLLRVLIYLFVIVRMAAFLVMGKYNVSRTYVKVISNI